MVIYASKITIATSRMNFGLSGNPIPLLIPIILTLILIVRNNVSFKNQGLTKLLGVSLLWIIAITFKFSDFSTGFQSYNVFLIYGILIAYIHIQVYGNSFTDVYEDVMVKFAILSLILWTFELIVPNIAASFFRLFPTVEASTGGGNHLFYLYNWFDPSLAPQSSYISIPRNSGCCFEPGYFASMLCLALLCNLSQNGLQWKNKKIRILTLALITTFSTTGYIIGLVLFSSYYVKRFSFSNIVKASFVVIPLFLLAFQLDFMGEKITQKSNLKKENEKFLEAEAYHSRKGTTDFHVSLDRFQSLYFEFENVKKDPILGYSRDFSESWFGKTFMSNYSLTGGLLKMLGQFGVIFGLYWYILLFKSSSSFSKNRYINRKYTLAITMILISISYGYFGTPIFMTFWMYGIFGTIKERIFII